MSVLREILDRPRATRAPGCFDAVTAKLVQAAGFEVAYLSGAATSAVVLGLPDLGFIGATDMVDHARRVAAATQLPLVADADTGYGNEVQAAHTVARYAAAGVAGLHVEDQLFPKRCGHMAGKAVIDADEMVIKLRAAVGAADGAIAVIARTDARSIEGLDAAIDRAARYAETGVDAVFIEGVSTVDELAVANARLDGFPLVVNCSEAGGDAPSIADLDVLAALGVRLVIHPVAALLASAHAAAATYAALAGPLGDARDVPKLAWPALVNLLES